MDLIGSNLPPNDPQRRRIARMSLGVLNQGSRITNNRRIWLTYTLWSLLGIPQPIDRGLGIVISG